MATLVLTAAGYALGGPLGGAIGALAGRQADAAIFAPKGRQGPRLGELAVQTSSYGTPIPKIFGTMRVAGTVIWATDLKEEKSTSGGGKGRPKTTSYSYSASFAVALSGRPLRAVRRIWADGKLLRGAAGDFKSATGFRFYPGGEEQPVDPLIAAAEGIGQAPAFRGLAYVLFEDFELADYGNRIPSLTFEVEADAGPVEIGTIATELAAGAVAAGETPAVLGYAASGDSVRGAIEGLSDVVPLSLVDTGVVLTLGGATGEPLAIGTADAGARTGSGAGGRSAVVRQAAGAIADEVGISYYDVARDYQTGLQRAARGGPGRRSDRRALPAALTAEAAKGFAERQLAAAWAGRASAKLYLSWRHSGIRPGAQVRMEGEAGLWKVVRWAFEQMIVRIELVRLAGGSDVLPGASPGRVAAQPDVQHGPTTLRLIDAPFYGELAGDRPQLLAAAAGAETGWRRAVLTASYDGGLSWQAAGATAAPAVLGTALTALAAGGSALFDRRGSVEVELLNEAMWLEGRSDAALVGGANLALLGDELIQFGDAEAIGPRRFRLRRLLRGRRGTEWAAGLHQAGDDFLLIEQQALQLVEPPLAVLGGEARLMAQGIGDGEVAAEASRTIGGEAMRPPSPVHLRATRAASGDIAIEWVRRSRGGWPWLSDSDAPLGEESEAYRMTISGTGFTRTVALAEPHFVYDAAAQAEDGAAGAIEFAVVQIGTHAPSWAARILFS